MSPIELLKPFKEKYPNYKVIYVSITGSKLYGTDNADSDTDYKGIFVPPTEDILLKTDIDHWTSTSGNNSSKNGADDTDLQLWSIHKFLNLISKGETGALDLLFSMKRTDTHVTFESEAYEIEKATPSLLHSNVKAFLGYCIGQSKKYAIKGDRYHELVDFIAQSDEHNMPLKNIVSLSSYKFIKTVLAPGPRGNKGSEDTLYLSVLGKLFDLSLDRQYILDKLTAMREQFGNRARSASKGVDYKSLSHAVRVLSEVTELLSEGTITFPLVDREYISSIKYGNEAVEDVLQHISTGINAVDTLLLTTTLPPTSNKDIYNELLLSILGPTGDILNTKTSNV